MYKIIFLSIAQDEPLEQHNFDLLDETFNSFEEARNYIIDTLIEQDKEEFIDGDDEMKEISDFDLYENKETITHEVYTYGDLVYKNEYKIVEIK